MLARETLCFSLPLHLSGHHAMVCIHLDRKGANKIATEDNEAIVHSRIGEWNEALNRHYLQFQEQYSDIAAQIYDTSKVFNEVLDNPEKYGFTNATAVCDEGDCIWYDKSHPTYAMHKILAEDLEKFLRNI